jgi:hypothetical protein
MRSEQMNKMLLCSVALALGPRAAYAGGEATEAEKRAAAELIYAQGSELITKRDFNAACPKFEEVVKLQPNGIGARMTLADCYVGQGKLASAHTTYGQIASMASLANQPDRAKDAAEKAAALAPRLSTLTIVVPPDVASLPDLAVMRGGLVVTASLFNVAVPVDGGQYTIVADATGKRPFTQSVKVPEEGGKAQLTLAFEAAPAPGGPGPSSEPPVDPVVGLEPSGDTSSGMHPVRIGGIVIGSVGLALAGVGIAVGVERTAKAQQYEEEYFDPDNTDKDRTILSDANLAAQNAAIAGWVLTGLGGAATVAGLIMIVAAPEGETPAIVDQPEVSLVLDVGPASLWLRGAF